jgi:hypothetical protein
MAPDHELPHSDPIEPGPARCEGSGPFERLILRGVTVVDGTGAPPFGPADLVIEDDRITAVVTVGNITSPLQPGRRPRARPSDRELDLSGHYVLPGLVDAHVHLGARRQVPSSEYVYKLWLGHGITSVREVGGFFNGFDFVQGEAARSAANEVTAPRIVPYTHFGAGRQEPVRTGAEARRWVEQAANAGASGVKFFGAPPAVFSAALAECRRLGLRTACHHAQQEVARANVLTTARWGLASIEHWYGLPEALLRSYSVQPYGPDYNYLDERARFAAAGHAWRHAAEPGTRQWDETIEELVALGVTLDPTLNVYVGLRDAARVRRSEWHDAYTAPQLWRHFRGETAAHGSFLDHWGTEDEIAWRHSYQTWMEFIHCFNGAGGRITAGSDAGYIYKVFGFGLVEELELLREAGLHTLEVIRAATLSGAELIGLDHELGSIEVGKLADLVVVAGNPLANLKVLYGHAADETHGVRIVIKGGVLYDAQRLRQDVREIVLAERQREGAETASTMNNT